LCSLRRKKKPKQVDDVEKVELTVLKRSWPELILITEELRLSSWIHEYYFGSLWRWLVCV